MKSEFDGDPIAGKMMDALNSDPPRELELRLRERLDALRQKMAGQTVTTIKPRQRISKRWRRVVAAVIASIAVVLLVMALPHGGSSQALAQVVDAVAKKSWLHARGKGPDGEPAEMWFSAKHGMLGFRSGKSCVLVDQVQKTMDVFGPPAGTDAIQRVPLKSINSSGITAARKGFLALLSGDLKQAMESGEQQVLEHKTTTMEVDGHEMTEHRFVVAGGEIRTESVLLVDASDGLPASWRMKHGETTLFEFDVSYPEHGPLTIVALGAPKDAPIVDQTPSDEFQRVLAATTTATQRFDSYRALVVETFGSEPANAWSLYRVWRKGNRWRIDRARPQFQGREEIPEGEDPKAWWLGQERLMKSYPQEIWDGKQFWLFDTVCEEPRQPDPDDPRFITIASLKRTPRQEMDPAHPSSPSHTYELPEFYGYDHLDIGKSLGFRADVETTELNGVKLTRVDIIKTWSKSPNDTSPERYWLDPQRGYLIVRKEYFRRADPEKPTGISELVTAEQTPQGLWYPTEMRMIGNSVKMETGERSDTYVRYFLDFDVEIPDELFDAKAVDLNDFWTSVK